jgi:transcriptional regulator with XRE-family HTH domain
MEPIESNTPIPVIRALRKLGEDIRNARLRRRIPTEIMAGRASISRTTLHKVERGDKSVSISTYATILFILGLLEKLSSLADVAQDNVGLQLDEERLPKRIRIYRIKLGKQKNNKKS